MAQASKVRKNLAIAFPNWDEATLERTTKNIFRQLGMAIAEIVKMDEIWSDREKRLEFAIDPLSIAHFKSGRGSVMVTAHVGAWQVTNRLARQQNMKITTVFAEDSNPSVKKAMRRLREGLGVHWLPTHAGVRPLIRELKAGNSIGLAIDTRLDTGELVPLFWRGRSYKHQRRSACTQQRRFDTRQRRALAPGLLSPLCLRARRKPEPGCRDRRPGEGNDSIDQRTF
jgi:KDO2-lipid IV(A) lauroyltransferase